MSQTISAPPLCPGRCAGREKPNKGYAAILRGRAVESKKENPLLVDKTALQITVFWYDLDLPDVIELRRQFIKETERRKFIPASFLDKHWLNEICVSENVLFIAAGVFYYFEESEVKEFLMRLADRFPGSEIIFDASSPYGIKTANRMVIKRSGLDENSFLKWGLNNAETLAAWDRRFRVLSTHYYFGKNGQHFGLRLRLFGWISDRLKVQYRVHLGMTG